jgi:colanic acid biosynthesis glycosyl transferase WcaI
MRWRRPVPTGHGAILLDDFAGHPHTFDLATELVAEGHQVTYHYCADDPGPKGARADAGPTVTPVALPRGFSKYSAAKRARDELEYGWRSARATTDRVDVVVVSNMPILAGLVHLAFARARRQRFILWWQDRQGGLARASGASELIARALDSLERALVRAADGVVAISPGFADEARSVRGRRGGVLLQPNWGTLGRIDVLPRNNQWRTQQGLDDAFVFLYTGTLARKHDPRLLLAISSELATEPSVRVVACCSGEGAEMLRAALPHHSNLDLLPLVEPDEYPMALATADVLVGLLEHDASGHSTPSKVLTYLCAGRPILLAAPEDNLAALTVHHAEGGWVVTPDADSVAGAARDILTDTDRRLRAGENARRYAEASFDIARIGTKFARFVLSGRSSGD